MHPDLLNDLIVEFGADSDVVMLAKHYIKNKDDEHEFCKLLNVIEAYEGGENYALKAILWLIEIKAIRELDHWEEALWKAKESKQGLIDLLKYDGADTFETIMLIEEHMTDEDVVEFMRGWEMDFDNLYDQLIEFIDAKMEGAA